LSKYKDKCKIQDDSKGTVADVPRFVIPHLGVQEFVLPSSR